MNEHELAKKIARHLNQGLAALGQDTAKKLQTARKKALASYKEHQPVFGLAWATALPFGRSRPGPSFYRLWLPLAVLIVGLVSITYWQGRQNAEIVETDAALLAEELPIHAYLDKDFEQWLESSSQ